MLQTFIHIIHVFVCVLLILVVLLQQGKGGGMGAAFGGASTQVFGGRGAGNILTRATAICAAIFMITSVSLAYLSSSGDRALRAKVAQEAGRRKDKGQLKERAPATTESAAPSGSAPAEDKPAEGMPTNPAPAEGTTTRPAEKAPASDKPAESAPANKPAINAPANNPAEPANKPAENAPAGGDTQPSP
jgi:preprotein translocase subunit SecG